MVGIKGRDVENNTDYLPLRDRIRRGDTVFGTFVKLPSPEVIEILGLAGLDFAICNGQNWGCSLTQYRLMWV